MNKLLIKLLGSTLARHLLAMLGVYIGAENTHSIAGMAAGVTMLALATTASYVRKRWPNLFEDGALEGAEMQNVFALAAQSVASQALAGLSGWLLAHGYEGNANDPLAVILFCVSYANSRANKATAK